MSARKIHTAPLLPFFFWGALFVLFVSGICVGAAQYMLAAFLVVSIGFFFVALVLVEFCLRLWAGDYDDEPLTSTEFEEEAQLHNLRKLVERQRARDN